MLPTTGFLALALAGVATTFAQDFPFRPPPESRGGPMPPGGGSTPREHEVHSATSADGLAWTRDEGIRLASASVPCVLNDGDRRILLYAVRPPEERGGVGGVACAVSTDGVHFEVERAFRIEGFSTRTAADPSIVKDRDGKFRLYYLASDHRGDPAHGENPHKINLALSDDGIRFREVGTAFTYDDLVDPDVFQFGDQWFMYVFGRAGTHIATSADGKEFAYRKVMSPAGWGTVAPVALADGRLRLYAFDQRTPIGNSVRSFLSTDGLEWTAEAGDRLVAREDEQITDPFVIPWRGGYKMYFKHSPARPRNFSGNRPPNFGEPNSQPRNDFAPNQPQRNLDPNGPWNRDVIAWRVSASGEMEKVATFDRAGVPTIARLQDGRLISAFQNFPADDNRNFDRVAARFSSDEGRTWTAATPIEVEGMETGLARPFDPTLVPLPDGRVRLYFTSNRSPDFRRSTPAIFSAISSDGVHYTFEPGVRFAIEERIVIDCAVVLHDGVFHLYVPDNGTAEDMMRGQQRREPPRSCTGYHATSEDGLHFTRADDVGIDGNRRWLGNAQSDGGLITFYGTGEGMRTGDGRPRGAFWMATSTDGVRWELVESPTISGGDPGAIKTRDGGLLVVITGESRMAPRNPPRPQGALPGLR